MATRQLNEFTKLRLATTRKDPLFSWHWAITSEIPFGKEYGVDHSFIETVEIPFNNVTSDGVFAGSGYDYLPVFHNVAAFTINVYADADGNSLKWLMAWKGKVKDFSTGLYGLPSEYKRDFQISLFNQKGKTVIKARLIGVWPADTGPIPLQYSSSDRLVYSQNFSIDDMSIE